MYEVRLAPQANRELCALKNDMALRIRPNLAALGQAPRPPGCLKLKGVENTWRIRVGNYRVMYAIDDKRRIVTILRIVPRDKAY